MPPLPAGLISDAIVLAPDDLDSRFLKAIVDMSGEMRYETGKVVGAMEVNFDPEVKISLRAIDFIREMLYGGTAEYEAAVGQPGRPGLLVKWEEFRDVAFPLERTYPEVSELLSLHRGNVENAQHEFDVGATGSINQLVKDYVEPAIKSRLASIKDVEDSIAAEILNAGEQAVRTVTNAAADLADEAGAIAGKLGVGVGVVVTVLGVALIGAAGVVAWVVLG